MIIHGECLEVMSKMEDNSIDSVVTDPPYGLSFMGKKWDYDIPSVEIWQECLRVLKPGGMLLSFAGTRTQHRMCTNIEDAGFEIRDMIAWVYGSGFPKSHNIGKAVDKRGGTTSDQSKEFAEYIKRKRTELKITLTKADEMVCGGTTNYSWFEGRPAGQRLPRKTDYIKIKELLKLDDRYDSFMEETEREVEGKHISDMGGLGGARLGNKNREITKGITEWEGWGTALKPALEPITVARKPLSEKTVAKNVLKWGTAGINIDGCRVGTDEITVNRHEGYNSNSLVESTKGKWEGKQEQVIGRFPANFIHDGSEEVEEVFPNTKSGKMNGNYNGFNDGNIYGKAGKTEMKYSGDSGSASRFFYCAKANKKDREEGNNHPTVKPTKLMRYLVRLVTPKDGTVLDPFMGSGSTGKACALEGFDFVGIEMEEEYVKIAKARIESVQL